MFFDRIYYVFFFSFLSSQNFKRGGALAPSMDAPPLLSVQTAHVTVDVDAVPKTAESGPVLLLLSRVAVDGLISLGR